MCKREESRGNQVAILVALIGAVATILAAVVSLLPHFLSSSFGREPTVAPTRVAEAEAQPTPASVSNVALQPVHNAQAAPARKEQAIPAPMAEPKPAKEQPPRKEEPAGRPPPATPPEPVSPKVPDTPRRSHPSLSTRSSRMRLPPGRPGGRKKPTRP